MHGTGIRLVGFTAENGVRLLLSIGFLAAVLLLRWVLRRAARWLLRGEHPQALRMRFWVQQVISLATAFLLVVGLLSIWFDDPARLATAFGLVSAGMAFALQRVITAFAGYIVILRGNTFSVGDRINMGGVRGDVVALGFIQTTLLEMGLTSGGDPGPAVWVHSRQFTGRVVSVSNAKIFDEPVYNYTKDFPFIWDEIRIPVRYADDRRAAERIMLEAAGRHALDAKAVDAATEDRLLQRFNLRPADFTPRVYYRVTENWLELTLRFVFRDHGTRAVKDAMTREILDEFDAHGIEVAAPRRQLAGLPGPPLPKEALPGVPPAAAARSRAASTGRGA